VREEAIKELLPLYLSAIKQFLCAVCRVNADLVDDLVQDFVTDKLLGNKFLYYADQNRGKFRNLLAKTLVNYAATWLKRHQRIRLVEFSEEHDIATEQLTAELDQEWLKQVVTDTLEVMHNECVESGRTDIWEVFRVRVADPILQDVDPMDYSQIVHHLQIQTPRQAINLLATAKRTFLRSLRGVLGRYVEESKDVDSEINILVEIVTRHCATP
jgi:hypothetical protein